jgi:hypothetical protein
MAPYLSHFKQLIKSHDSDKKLFNDINLFDNLRCLEGLLREVCVPLGFDEMGYEISILLHEVYQINISNLDESN